MPSISSVPCRLQLEEAKLFRAQSQNVMAINLAMYISQNYHSNEEASDAYRLIGKWLAETRSSKLGLNLILCNVLMPDSLSCDFPCFGVKLQLKNNFGEVFETSSLYC